VIYDAGTVYGTGLISVRRSPDLIADTSREHTLTVIPTMLVDECGTRRAVTHAVRQLSQVRASGGPCRLFAMLPRPHLPKT
jgi:hypothetical protein